MKPPLWVIGGIVALVVVVTVGHTATMDTYLRNLAKRFGAPPLDEGGLRP